MINIYFVAILHRGYPGVITGNLFVTITITVGTFIWFSRFIGFSFSFEYFKKIMIFITPIYVVNIFFFLLSLSDRFFLNHFLTPVDVGLYSFGSKIGSIVMIGIITPFSIAIVPYALSIAKENHFKKTYAKIIKYFFVILVFFSLWIFYFSKEIVLLISNESYIKSSGIIGPILLSSIFYGLYYNLSIAIDIVEKTYLSTIVVIAGAAVSITINFLTIPYIGIYGSSLASCVSNTVLFLFIYYFCQKNYPIQYEIGAFFKILGIIFIYIVFYGFITRMEVREGITISIKVALCILFPMVLFLLHVFDVKEREFAIQFCKKIAMRRQ
jgi:O-antigen/teichoic acid export membrane protein